MPAHPETGPLLALWGVSKNRAVAVTGDLRAKKLGVAAAELGKLEGRIDHVDHLAAVYDLGADEEAQVRVDIEGARRVAEFAKPVAAGHLHHVGSIAAAGLYEGVFREHLFEQAEGLEPPYFMTKHEAEKIVRKECKLPWTVYRPAAVVGDSKTGEMDRIDGPYHFIELIPRMRQMLPPWFPSVGLEDARVHSHSVDIADPEDGAAFVKALEDEHGSVDFLVNNAGRAIRRFTECSCERFHDFERTMQLNCFGCLRVTMGLLPGMVKKRKGHVVKISSIGVLPNAPRFLACVAGTAALDAWTRCACSKFADQGINFATINMPLVRTPKIAPTKIYRNLPTLSPEQAAEMIAQACVNKPVRIATRLGVVGELLHAAAPRVAQIVMNTSFRMVPDSESAKGEKGGKPQPSAEAAALQQMMRGIHF